MAHSPAWDDLDAFVTPGEFAEVVIITLANGTTRQVNAIFDDPYFNDQLGEYDLDAAQPRLTAKMADLVGVNRGDEVLVAGVAYNVLFPPLGDGTGMATLKMALA